MNTQIKQKMKFIWLFFIVLVVSVSTYLIIESSYFSNRQAQKNMDMFRDSLNQVSSLSNTMNELSLPYEKNDLFSSIDYTIEEFDQALIALDNLRPYVNRLHPLGLINKVPNDFYNIHVPTCLFEHYKESLIDIKSSFASEEIDIESIKFNLDSFKREINYLTMILNLKDTWNKETTQSYLSINELLLDIGLKSGYFSNDEVVKYEKCKP